MHNGRSKTGIHIQYIPRRSNNVQFEECDSWRPSTSDFPTPAGAVCVAHQNGTSTTRVPFLSTILTRNFGIEIMKRFWISLKHADINEIACTGRSSRAMRCSNMGCSQLDPKALPSTRKAGGSKQKEAGF